MDNNWETLKNQGNNCINNQQYQEAVDYYLQAIEWEKSNSILYSNTSQAYLHWEYYSKALTYADLALQLDETNIKALYRKISALNGWKKYDLALELSQSNSISDFPQIKRLRTKLQSKVRNTEGEYDFYTLINTESTEFYKDIADYTNPKIHLDYDPIKGITVIAKEEISQGELLHVSKAIVAIPSPQLNYNLNRNEQWYNKLLQEHKYLNDENPQFYAMYDGGNRFNNYEQRLSEENKTNLTEKMKNVLQCNSFETFRSLLKPKHICYGLWYFPSFFNHSCLPNTYHYSIGDMFICNSIREIKKNEEITIRYLPLEEDYFSRQYKISTVWGFNCRCPLCESDMQKLETCPVKKIYNEYLIIINTALAGTKYYYNKEQDNMLSFLQQNEAEFSDIELGVAYLFYAILYNNPDWTVKKKLFEIAFNYLNNKCPQYESISLFHLSNWYSSLNLVDNAAITREKIKLLFHALISRDEPYINFWITEAFATGKSSIEER